MIISQMLLPFPRVKSGHISQWRLEIEQVMDSILDNPPVFARGTRANPCWPREIGPGLPWPQQIHGTTTDKL
jgi:hypothetical protein